MINESQLERQRRAAHAVETWVNAVGGSLVLVAAALAACLFCKLTPAQLSAESDLTAEDICRAELARLPN